jgi:para-nitrobenzyl esterase
VDILFLALNTVLMVTVWSHIAVFIHGGSYNTGSGAMYSGAEMVEFYAGKAILVTVNYRLNVFGFLGSELLRAQDPENGSTGNQGLQDQRVALEWVRDNIGE